MCENTGSLNNFTNFELITELDRRGLISDSVSKKIVINKLVENTNFDISVILGLGIPKEKQKCRECLEDLETDNFSFYQSRVGKDGFLMRSNALCGGCATKLNRERQEVFQNSNIPEKPSKGDVCPSCKREWIGNWHRHHEGDKFIEWLCTHCNTHLSDQRRIFIK